MTSSLYPPARTTIDLFPALGELMRVEQEAPLRTRRLDDLEEARPADFLKFDVPGAERMVLEHATKTLKDVAVLQSEVEFLELYEGQPLFADDALLRRQGFCFLRFPYTMGLPFRLLQQGSESQAALSQLLWGDAIYVRDFRQRHQWSERQLKAAAFLLHELYAPSIWWPCCSLSLTAARAAPWQECYLGSCAEPPRPGR